MQLTSVTKSYLKREEEMLQQIISLQEQLKTAPEAIPSLDFAHTEPTNFEIIPEVNEQGTEEEEDPLAERMMDNNTNPS